MIKRALLSVSDKTGLIEFAKTLAEQGIEIVSTGGTKKALAEAGIPVFDISEKTGFPEMLDGRVKTLHPNVHGGLLFVRGNPEHEEMIKKQNIEPLDLVVVNLYPFQETQRKEGVSEEECIEHIDIGGPSMLRSAAKNYQSVTVVTDPADYESIANEIKETGDTALETRKILAGKVFAKTAAYDSAIATFFNPKILNLQYEKMANLRYGENPHQSADFYRDPHHTYPSITNAIQHQGKQLSFNNLVDGDAAFKLIQEFTNPSVAIIKHANPCGVATADSVEKAFKNAFAADTKSPFGGVIAMNRTCDASLANALSTLFLEIVIAPSFSPEALDIFSKKPRLRILEVSMKNTHSNTMIPHKMMKTVSGGLLIQDCDQSKILEQDLKVVTKKDPTSEEIEQMLFAWKVVKHAKSNAIVLAKNFTTLGIGAGQTSRVNSGEIAIKKAGEGVQGCVMASDAFFPFADGIEGAAKEGVTAIIQPGGSIRDTEVIECANSFGVSMVFCEKRAFLH